VRSKVAKFLDTKEDHHYEHGKPKDWYKEQNEPDDMPFGNASA
jgi:hypothetical protein